MKKRLLAFCLTLCLLVGLLPITALATGDSAFYQNLTISCAEGGVADKVKLEVAYSGGESRAAIVIKESGTYTVSGMWDTTVWDGYANMGAVLIVDEGVQADITLDNVTIRPDQAVADDNADSAGIRCKDGSKVTLRLSGDNTVYGRNLPAIELQNAADVTITGGGSLTAVCGKGRNGVDGRYPGIGVGQFGGGTLAIHGGDITATGDLAESGSPGGPGIGDNGVKSGAVLKRIVIEEQDGYDIDLTATGGKGAPGIGSLSSSSSVSNTQILICSGKIMAQAGAKNGYYGSAGIGGGDKWIASSVDPGFPNVQIEISGGDITAMGTDSGAGIGGGNRCAPTIHITGGTIQATGGSWAAGIGAGTSGSAGAVTFFGTPQVLAGSQEGLAVSQNATASGTTVINGQFTTPLPGSVTVVDENGGTIKEIDNIPTGLKSMACTLENQARTVRVGQDDETFACAVEGGQDVFDWNVQPDQVLTKTDLAWKEIPTPGHTITATAGPNGDISPKGQVTVAEGGSQTFTITANQDYHIADVTVDGQSVGAVSTYTFENVTGNHIIHAEFAYDMPAVGFKVRVNPRSGSQTETVYSDSQTLEVDLRDTTSAYIKPYIDVTIPSQTPWEEHVYYTFEFHNVMDGQPADDNDLYGDGRELFAKEYLYNRTNTGNTKKLWVTADELTDERLDTSYYQIVVRAYRSNHLGVENPESDTLLGTAQANLHVRMTWSKIVLDWLDSYFWDEYYIDNDLAMFYDTPEALISGYLSQYDSTSGCDGPENNFLEEIPVTWALKSGTAWSTEPGAENVLTWTAHPDQAPDIGNWEVPADFELSGDVPFRNPFAVTFRDGETVIQTEYRKNGDVLPAVQFPQVPEKPGYTSRWSVETDLTVTANMEVTAVHTPIDYPITYELGGGDNAPRNPASYTVEDTVTLAQPTWNGHVFDGWTWDGQTIPQKDVTIPAGTTGPLTFTAHWSQPPVMHAITANAGAGGAISPSGRVEVEDGKSQTFTITADQGYHIEDVTVDGQSVGAVSFYTFVAVDGNHIIEAVFAKDSSGGGGGTHYSYTLRYDTNGGEAIQSESKSYSWTKQYEDLPTPVRGGYTFDGWYLDSKLTDPVEDDVKVNRSTVTIYAAWSKDKTDPDNNGVSDWLNTGDHNAYLNGYGNGAFGPNDNMTRAQVAQMFYNLLLDKKVPVTTSFTDVPADAWYAKAVNSLASLGILEGVGNNLFVPDRPITRAEFTVIAMRFTEGDVTGTNIFSDVHTNDWFYDQVVGSIQYGWITGYADGTFQPNKTISRAEVTTIVNRMLGRSADEDYVDGHEADLLLFSDVSKDYWAYYQIVEATNAHNYEKNGDTENWTKLR